MQVRRLSNRQLLSLDPSVRIGAGGEALVFAIVADKSSVVKLYKKPTSRRAEKLAVMISHPPDDPMAAQGHVSIAWPTDIVLSVGGNEQVIGFVMPKVAALRSIIEVYNPGIRRVRSPLFNYMYLLRAARNLSAAFRALHARQYVVGDVNECNTFVADSALVSLLDTDSFQVRDPNNGRVFRCPVGRAEFTPPELQGMEFDHVDRRPEHDLFGLGILIFQLLMGGQHPFNGIPLSSGDSTLEVRIQKGHFPYGTKRVPIAPPPAAIPFSILAPPLQQLCIDCFERGCSDPSKRPSAESWQKAVEQVEDSLIHCSRNNQHYYSEHLTACPWCERAAKFGIDPFPSKRALQAANQLGTTVQQVPLITPAPTPIGGAVHRAVPPPLPKPLLPQKSGRIPALGWVGIVFAVLFWIWIAQQQPDQKKPITETSTSSPSVRVTPSESSAVAPPSVAPVQASKYPPTGYFQDDPVITSPNGQVRIEQWNNRHAGPDNVSVYQTWIVGSSWGATRLQEVSLQGQYAGRDSGSIGFPSSYHFSPDGRYLVRLQSIFNDFNGIYLYRVQSRLHYEPYVSDLNLRASKFFARETRLNWENGIANVEFTGWAQSAYQDNYMILALRGYSEGKAFSVERWRCLFYPSAEVFQVPNAWTIANNNAIKRAQQLATTLPNNSFTNSSPAYPATAPPGVVNGMPGERFPQTRARMMDSSEVKTWTGEQIQYAVNEMYARHGADFLDPKVARLFSGFPWYRSKTGMTYDDAEKSFSSIELNNVKLLGYWRDARKGGVAPEPAQAAGSLDNVQAQATPPVIYQSRPIAEQQPRKKSSNSVLLYSPQPEYPPSARSLQIDGSGKFKLRFNGQGTIRSVQILDSTGNQLLDAAAMAALRQWRVVPGTEMLVVPVTFRWHP